MADRIGWQPTTLAEALELLAGPTAPVPVAGGTDLMVQAREIGRERRWCDISRVAELRGVASGDGGAAVRIGALATWSELVTADLIREHVPLLGVAALTVGAPAIRNRGTLGGNVVNASPAGDGLPVLLVHDAEVELASLAGRRRLPVGEFWLDYRRTELRPGELLVAIHVPLAAAGDPPTMQVFRKVGPRRAQAIAKLSLAARFWRRTDGSLRGRLALGAVAPVPLRCRATEELLGSQPLDAAVIEAACARLQGEIRPIDDHRSTARYRSRVAQRLLAALLQRMCAGV
jgi:xanthine dehydrogenase FAD-binding subunit